MRRSLPILLAAGGFLLPGPGLPSADPVGVVSLSWDRPADAAHPQITRRDFSGPGIYDLYVSLTGQSDPISALQATLRIFDSAPRCSGGAPISDAWAFHDGGCQAGEACYVAKSLIDLVPPPSRGAYQDLADWSFESPDRSQLFVAEAYHYPTAPDPTATYPVLRLRLDLSGAHAGDSGPGCGGAERPLTIQLERASYVSSPSSFELVFHQANYGVGWNRDGGVSICDPFAQATSPDPEDEIGGLSAFLASGARSINFTRCDQVVPVAASTWGRMKAAYR